MSVRSRDGPPRAPLSLELTGCSLGCFGSLLLLLLASFASAEQLVAEHSPYLVFESSARSGRGCALV